MYKIEKYLEQGTVEYENNMLVLSETHLELSVRQGEILDGTIQICSQTGAEVHCAFYSGNYRMQCRTDGFIGREGELSYRFDATGLDGGASVSGEFTILSDAGEFMIPYVVSVMQPLADTSLGEIRNLFHFANLAHANWEEAVSLFYTDEFSLLFSGHDRQYYNLYRGLRAKEGNERNVDEFLIAIHKKQPIRYAVREESLLLRGDESAEEEVTLVKNGWGAVCVRVETEGAFLAASKETLHADDFEQDTCKVCFTIRKEYLHEGSNVGAILLCGGTDTISVPVILNMPVCGGHKREERSAHKKLIAKLTHCYLDFVTRPEQKADALKQAEQIIEDINKGYGRQIAGRLYQAHLSLETGNRSEAKWVLSHIENTSRRETMTDAQYAYYLFLRARTQQDSAFMRSAQAQLERMMEQGDGGYAACLLYQRLTEGKVPPESLLAVYEQCYRSGACSPVMYRECYALFMQDPSLLMKLTSFEIAVLRFAIRYGIYTKEMAQRVNDVAMRRKEMTPELLRFMEQSCQTFMLDETILAICTLLIRTGLQGSVYFPWYALAVERNLRITSLYEYYMMSSDMEKQELPPRSVLMYFAYRCSLDDRHKAHLYALVTSHRDAIPDLFSQYEAAILDFASQMLGKGEITEDLSVLYRYMLKQPGQQPVRPESLEAVSFVCVATVGRTDIVRVIVVHDKLAQEAAYPVEHGKAYITCYTQEYVLLAEDEEGNRFYDPDAFSVRKLMSTEKMMVLIGDRETEQIGCLLYRAFVGGQPDGRNQKLWPVYRSLSQREEVEAGYRSELKAKFLHLYGDQEMTEELGILLADYDLAHAGQEQRAEAIRFFAQAGQDEKAFALLFSYGFEMVPPKTLARMISRKLEKDDAFDDRMMALIHYTFRLGKYTQEMLQYLRRYFEGSLRQMRDIWQACVRFDLDASSLAERILQAYLFSHGYLAEIPDIFSYYLAHRRRESVVLLYMQSMAYRYFVKDQLIMKGMSEGMEYLIGQGCHLDDLCMIAYLCYMAKEVTMYTGRQKKIIGDLVADFVTRRQYVPLFAPFAAFLPWLKPYTELTYVEYKTEPGCKVTIHYLADEQKMQYREEKLKEICGGYFCKRFPLFFGECLEYYFTEQKNGQKMLTESGYIEKSDMPDGEAQSRYGLINDMMMSRSLGDDRTQQEWMKKYVKKAGLVSQLFEL